MHTYHWLLTLATQSVSKAANAKAKCQTAAQSVVMLGYVSNSYLKQIERNCNNSRHYLQYSAVNTQPDVVFINIGYNKGAFYALLVYFIILSSINTKSIYPVGKYAILYCACAILNA